MNTFYHGDCLFVLKHDIPKESVDLIYLDPPFFTGKVQKGTMKWQPDRMEISYEDSKRFWSEKADEMREKSPAWLRHIALKRPDFASYLYYMMERLEACHKVLKNTGGIFLHCDWRASHYLKMIMDEPDLFGYQNFRDEIIWHRNSGGIGRQSLNKRHDTIFRYSKTDDYYYDGKAIGDLREQDEGTFGGYFGVDEDGRRYREVRRGGKVYKYYMDEPKNPDDVWAVAQIPERDKTERSGYPTQKPQKLLERIIKMASREGELVLDPFCGCGTTVIMASKLNRRFIGIDIDTSERKTGELPTAFTVIKNLSHELFNESRYVSRDISEVLEMNPRQFEDWVNEYYKATKPHPDLGVDGVTPEGIPIQVKTFQIKYDTIDKLLSSSKFHPSVRRPIKKLIFVSQVGYDDGARKRKFDIETHDGIEVALITPEDMLKLG
jgi:DNA modification methylase